MSTSAAKLSPVAPPISLGKRLLFASILLALVLAALEVGARVYMRATRGYSGGAFMQYQFDPYKNIALTPHWRDTRGVSHNSAGFRGRGEYAKPKPRGTFRVILMGASTAYGLGGMWTHLQTQFQVLDDSTTIDRYLERSLAAAFPDRRVEVINAGIPSIWTHHHLIYLNQSILAYEPDVVIFLDGWNDYFFFDREHDQFASYVQTEQASRIMAEPTFSSLLRMNAWWLFRKSAFAHVTGRAVQAVLPALRGGPSPIPISADSAAAGATEVFDRSARRMIERSGAILRHEGVPALYLLQPILALERDRLDRMPPIERKLFEFNLSAERPGYEAFIRRAVPMISARARESVTAIGAAYMDLTAIYDRPVGQVFTDYCHLTPTGNRLLAEHIAPEVVRLGRERIAKVAAGT